MKTKLYPGLLILALFLLIPSNARSQRYYSEEDRITLGLHFDPVISWFGSDTDKSKNEGARPGYNFGLNFNKYFGKNYSVSLGASLIAAGGRLSHTDTTLLEFTNFGVEVKPGDRIIYRIQYLSFPAGIKLQTNQIGYLTYFADLGFDPKIAIGGKADIKEQNITGEKATTELKVFNFGWHLTGGVEYSIGGTTSLVLGLNFENNFMDITEENGRQPGDKITHKLLSIRLGIIF